MAVLFFYQHVKESTGLLPKHSIVSSSCETLPVEHPEVGRAEPNCVVVPYRFGVHPNKVCVCPMCFFIYLN